GQVLYEETLVAGGTQDTGWKSYSKEITCSLLSSGAANKIRIVLFLGDGWSANWNQKNWYDNIKLESSALGASCGGTTSPAPGTYTYVEGESVQVTALPNTGWKLLHWTLDGASIGSQNPASVTMNKDHMLVTVFTQGQSASDFAVSANPSSLSIAKGSSGSTTIAVNAINGYSTGVSLTLSGLPSGATYSFLPWSSNAPFTSTLTINADTANVGTYTLSITGSGLADGKVRTTTITLTVTPQFDFSLSLNPSSGTVQQGGTVQTTVTTTLLSGTSSSVSLSAGGGPLGTTFTFSPASGSPTFASTLTISIPSNAATGTYQVTISGSGSGGISRTATYQLTVNPQAQQPFNHAMSVSPSSLSIAKGSSAQTTVSVDLLAGSSAQAVVLSSTGQPSGVAVSFNPSTGNPTFKSTMSISVSSAANAGTYTLTITGTAGALAKSTTLTLTIVNTADFTLSATPGTLTVQQGSTGSTTIKIDALNGYSNIVSLSATGLPSGVTYAFIPSSGKPTFSSTLTLSTSQSAATGTFTVTINGAGADGKTRTTTLTLTIPKQTTYQLAVAVKDQFNAPVKGITVTIDSSSYTTDTSGQVTVQVSQGTHTIAVHSSYLQSSGTRYLFEKWSDGGGVTANPRTVTVNSAVTFTAMEKKQHYLTMQTSASSAGTVSPSSDWYDSGKKVTISASASSGYKFDKWSGSGSGSYSGTSNPATVTVNAPITETASFQKVYTVSVKTLATYGGLSTSPLSGLKVKIGSSTVQTDSSGVAAFALPAGTYQVSVVDTSTTKSISSVDVRCFAFKWWDNLSTSNPRTINVNGPSTLVAYYPITWQQYTLNPNTYTAEVADPSKTDSLGNPVPRSVSLPYAKSASNWLLGWEWSMDVRTDSKGAYYGAHDYAAWGYTKAFTTKWNSKLTPATHSYAVDKLVISYSGYLKVKGLTSDSDQGLYFRYRDTYN
ncbi:MAG: hypothetical protein HRF40_01285, partial [Nitrososphaera sp.]